MRYILVFLVFSSCFSRQNQYTKIVDDFYLKRVGDKECIISKKQAEDNVDLNYFLVHKINNQDDVVSINIIDTISVNNKTYETAFVSIYDKKYINQDVIFIDMDEDASLIDTSELPIRFDLKDTTGVTVSFDIVYINDDGTLPYLPNPIKFSITKAGEYDLYIFPIKFNNCD